MKDKLTLSLGVAVGSSIVSKFRACTWMRMVKTDMLVSANRPFRHSFHCYSWVDIGKTSDIAFRPSGICRTLPLRFASPKVPPF